MKRKEPIKWRILTDGRDESVDMGKLAWLIELALARIGEAPIPSADVAAEENNKKEGERKNE